MGKKMGKLICSVVLSLVVSVVMGRGPALAAGNPDGMVHSDSGYCAEEELLRNNPEACGKCWLGVMVQTATYTEWGNPTRILCQTYTAQGFYDYYEKRVMTHSYKCSYEPCGNTAGPFNTPEKRIRCGVTEEIH